MLSCPDPSASYGSSAFLPLPLPYYAFVAIVVATYLVVANAVKGRLLRRLDRPGGGERHG